MMLLITYQSSVRKSLNEDHLNVLKEEDWRHLNCFNGLIIIVIIIFYRSESLIV